MRWCLVLLLACGHPKPQSGEPQPSGNCEPGRCLDDITKLIQERRTYSRACYDTGRKKKPDLEGRIIINFTIDAEGLVTDTSQGMQDNQIEEPGIVACVSDVIKGIKFEKSPSGRTTRAYHRFEFSR